MNEQTIIQVIKQSVPAILPANVIGIGDDCAVLPWNADHYQLVTKDLLVENTHFLFDQIAANDLGYKAASVNLSDIAAMGGDPVACYLSLAMPEKISLPYLQQFMLGVQQALKPFNVLLLGGDTSQSQHDFFIDICLQGKIKRGNLKLRSHAQPGDLICLTGPTGDAKAGLELLLEQRHQKHPVFSKSERSLIRKQHHPEAQCAIGQWLARFSAVHAMIDVSDGLYLDLRNIATASGCGFIIDVESLPLSAELSQVGATKNWIAHDFALTGGEDYVLLFTVRPQDFDQIAALYKKEWASPLFQIGKVSPQPQTTDLFYNSSFRLDCLAKTAFTLNTRQYRRFY